MGRTSTISRKGQITIPLEVRQRLGVTYGDQVKFDLDKDVAILRPAAPKENPFAKYAGCLDAFNSIEESTAWVREMRDPDKEYP
jgi:AbrB family looped-hinge helix DNA binding protein